MLRFTFWEDKDKKEDGYMFHCCGVDEIDNLIKSEELEK